MEAIKARIQETHKRETAKARVAIKARQGNQGKKNQVKRETAKVCKSNHNGIRSWPDEQSGKFYCKRKYQKCIHKIVFTV